MKLAFAGLELLNERRVELPGEEVKLLECMCEFVISDGLLGTDEPGPALEVLKRVQEAGKALLPKLAAEDKAQLSLGLHQARSFELQALVRLGLRDEARELARLVAEEVHATRNEMKVVDGKWALAEFLAADGHIGEAIKVLDDLLAEPTSNHAKNELMFTLAACYSAAGQHTEAMRTLHELRSHVEHVRQTAAIATAESIAVLCDDQDATFERAVQRSATTFAVAQESARSQTHKKLVYLTEIAISAEFDESSELRGAWHPVRVGVLARLVAQAAGLDADLCWQAEVAGRLHDVGKCAIPDRLKLKAGPLSDEERLLVREHAEFGARLLEAVNEPTLAAAALGIRHHHERYDGRGYPQGLSGEQIPIVARLVALCESFDAMMLRRKFRATKRTLPDALREVVFCSGTQFDPLLAHVLVEVIHRLESSSGNAMMQLEALGRESAQVESFERISSILAVRNCATFPSASASG